MSILRIAVHESAKIGAVLTVIKGQVHVIVDFPVHTDTDNIDQLTELMNLVSSFCRPQGRIIITEGT